MGVLRQAELPVKSWYDGRGLYGDSERWEEWCLPLHARWKLERRLLRHGFPGSNQGWFHNLFEDSRSNCNYAEEQQPSRLRRFVCQNSWLCWFRDVRSKTG